MVQPYLFYLDLSRMNIRFRVTIGSLFILAGLLLGYDPIFHYLSQHTMKAEAFSGSSYQVAETPRIQGEPTRIAIPSLTIDLQIEKGYYNPNQLNWTLSKTKASYAVMTPQPNNKGGNTFIYGHDTKEVFSKLSGITQGAQAIVYTDNGYRFTYQLVRVNVVKPTMTGFLNYQGPPIMTVQTCSGLWYENRSLFTFNLVEVV